MTLREAIAAIVESIVGPRIDYAIAYQGRVVMQHADGTLDLEMESDRIPSLTQVPIRYGCPGYRAKVRKGATVYVEFIAADPCKPVVTGWLSGSCDEVTLDATRVRLADGDRRLACLGDTVAVSMPLLVGSVKYSPIGVDPTVTAHGVITSALSRVSGQ